MAWNTAQMRAILDRWVSHKRVVPPKLIGKIAATRLEGITLRGVFRFPIERYAEQIPPSQNVAKTSQLAETDHVFHALKLELQNE